jgi:hypothetical protein
LQLWLLCPTELKRLLWVRQALFLRLLRLLRLHSLQESLFRENGQELDLSVENLLFKAFLSTNKSCCMIKNAWFL